MEEDQLKDVLLELYTLEPSLKEHEAVLIKLLAEIRAAKPDTRYDREFALALKKRLLDASSNYEDKTQSNQKIFNINFMNKRIFIAAGSLALASLVFLAFINYYRPGSVTETPWNLGNNAKVSQEKTISELPAGAFGSLASLGGANSANEMAAGQVMGLGGGAASPAPTMVSVSPEMGDASVSSEAKAVETIAADMRIMPPFYGFKYVYKGEELELSEESASVYRRLKGQGTLAQDLARTLGSFGFSELSLSTFSDLKLSNFSVMEDKEQGLMITFDFNEDTVNIYENWQKWGFTEREACAGDQACWDRFRLKLEDVPSDETLVSWSNSFLAKHKVSLENYGEPQVDNSWRGWYESSEDKANFYIPEYASVIYPLLINGEEVRDQSGGYAGLRININLLKKAVSGLSGLMPYRYETSNYALETSNEKIVSVAENGGWNRNYYIMEGEDNREEIELGTPTKAYVQLWQYNNGKNDELLVPSLIFPIIKRPENMIYYYGQSYVVVPLVKEMIDELSKQPEWLPKGGPIEPFPMPAIDAGMEGEVETTVELEIAPVSEPMLRKQ